jgi:hypothetical protein
MVLLVLLVSVTVNYFLISIWPRELVETNRCAQQFKNSRGSIFSKQSIVNDWQPVTIGEIYNVLALIMLMGILQKSSLRLLTNQLVATPIFGSVISLDRFESICRVLHFVDTNFKDTFEGLQKLFKIYPIVTHQDSKFWTPYLPSKTFPLRNHLVEGIPIFQTGPSIEIITVRNKYI